MLRNKNDSKKGKKPSFVIHNLIFGKSKTELADVEKKADEKKEKKADEKKETQASRTLGLRQKSVLRMRDLFNSFHQSKTTETSPKVAEQVAPKPMTKVKLTDFTFDKFRGEGHYAITYEETITDPILLEQLRKLKLIKPDDNRIILKRLKLSDNEKVNQTNTAGFLREGYINQDLTNELNEFKDTTTPVYIVPGVLVMAEDDVDGQGIPLILSQLMNEGSLESYLDKYKEHLNQDLTELSMKLQNAATTEERDHTLTEIYDLMHDSVNMLLEFFEHILKGIEQLNKFYTCHGDIGLHNLLIEKIQIAEQKYIYVVRIIDFGLAEKMNKKHPEGPDQNVDITIKMDFQKLRMDADRLQKARVSFATDIFSAKVTFLEILSHMVSTDFLYFLKQNTPYKPEDCFNDANPNHVMLNKLYECAQGVLSVSSQSFLPQILSKVLVHFAEVFNWKADAKPTEQMQHTWQAFLAGKEQLKKHIADIIKEVVDQQSLEKINMQTLTNKVNKSDQYSLEVSTPKLTPILTRKNNAAAAQESESAENKKVLHDLEEEYHNETNFPDQESSSDPATVALTPSDSPGLVRHKTTSSEPIASELMNHAWSKFAASSNRNSFSSVHSNFSDKPFEPKENASPRFNRIAEKSYAQSQPKQNNTKHDEVRVSSHTFINNQPDIAADNDLVKNDKTSVTNIL